MATTYTHTWDSFLPTADEFIKAYYKLENPVTPVHLFVIGHAVELYLKAAYTKKTGNIAEAIQLGHNLHKLWKECKEMDIHFMPNYEIRDSVYSKSFLEEDIATHLDSSDVMHFIQHQNLYMIMRYLPDIKYFGAPLKNIKKPYSYAWVYPDPFWHNFFLELRAFLGVSSC